jgi:hypothetical protein
MHRHRHFCPFHSYSYHGPTLKATDRKSKHKTSAALSPYTRAYHPFPPPITIYGEALEVVTEFQYLGTIIVAGGTDDEDLRQRIGRA